MTPSIFLGICFWIVAGFLMMIACTTDDDAIENVALFGAIVCFLIGGGLIGTVFA